MPSFFNASNLKTAAIAALAVIVVQQFTASQSTLIRGAATVGAIAIALPLAAKV